jgi:hypothetical protein
MEHLRYSIRNQILFNQVGPVFKASSILVRVGMGTWDERKPKLQKK